jgi:hypothetical protein
MQRQQWQQPDNQLSINQLLSQNQKLKEHNKQLTDCMLSLDREIGMWMNVTNDLIKFMQVNVLLNREIDWLDKTIQQLIPFVTTSQIWMKDALQHQAMVETLCGVLTDPGFLSYWAFHIWSGLKLTQFDQELLSEQFLKLLAPYTNPSAPATPNYYDRLTEDKSRNIAYEQIEMERQASLNAQQQANNYLQQQQAAYQQYFGIPNGNNQVPLPPIPQGSPASDLNKLDLIKSQMAQGGDVYRRLNMMKRQGVI